MRQSPFNRPFDFNKIKNSSNLTIARVVGHHSHVELDQIGKQRERVVFQNVTNCQRGK